ncbi:AAA family ATPase (plasmid) [Streptomyces sp. NBC_01220]|uniref:3'-5' exonuclease n=1 Tax=Streptomyces sp. NBC_01220 TaxID=2903781 RepID=UPI002F90BA6C|nr:AAA family ATPase [Streptomyces sp. NBC_01220]
MPPTGHHVVLGTAGTGKTVMAVLRALYLSDPGVQGSGKTLLVTYNNALVTYLNHLSNGASSALDIRTYGRFARGYLNDRGGMQGWNAIVNPNQRRSLVETAIRTTSKGYKPHTFFDRESGWFRDELSWITGMGINSEEEYLKAERLGRRTALNANLRSVVWKILENYRELRDARGHQYDWDDIAMTVRDQLAIDGRPRLYRHVIIDEGQDLAPEQIRSLVEAIQPDGSVTFFGDYAQQIYGQGMSWRACGLMVRQTETFRDNYRNSTAIANVAIALSSQPFFGRTDELVPPVAPTAAGPKPTLVHCVSQEQEISVIQDAAKRLGSVGTVAVVARTWADADRACEGIQSNRLQSDKYFWNSSPGVYRTTYHSAKGLEFDAVLMPFCGADKVPLNDVVESLGNDDAAERESKLLYVALTRAKSDLLITYSGALTPLLPSTAGLFAEVSP